MTFLQRNNVFHCFKRPYNKALQVFGCLNFFGYLTPTDEKFVYAVKFWLGHPVKLFFGEESYIFKHNQCNSA